MPRKDHRRQDLVDNAFEHFDTCMVCHAACLGIEIAGCKDIRRAGDACSRMLRICAMDGNVKGCLEQDTQKLEADIHCSACLYLGVTTGCRLQKFILTSTLQAPTESEPVQLAPCNCSECSGEGMADSSGDISAEQASSSQGYLSSRRSLSSGRSSQASIASYNRIRQS